MHITVSPYAALPLLLEDLRPSHLITLLDPATMIETPPSIASDRHLKLGIHDIAEPRDDLIHPTETHVRALIDFLGGWDRREPLLVHCWMGVSRSSAAAYIALCLDNEGREAAAARHLRAQGRHAQPNPLIIAHADRVMRRQGRMIRAINGIGAGDMSTLGTPFRLTPDFS